MAAVLAATILIVGVSAILAALLVVAERYLVNYGTCEIDVNKGSRRLEVEGGNSLLASLLSQGIFIPSACGGRGTCAYCKVKVLEGGGPTSPTEEPLLGPDEVAGGVRISCQVKVRRDLAIEIPEELFNIRQFEGTVEQIQDLTYDIKRLRIRLREPDTIDFVAGQYVQLQTPLYGDIPEPVYRAYSLANPPHDRQAIELLIRRVPGGICTTWVFTILKEGDVVTFNGPYGEFRLTDTDREMFWIAGGSGMAPFWAMLRHMKEQGLGRPTTFFFGALARRDLFFLEEMRQLERELDWFRFIPALSKPAEGDSWDGETGLITEVVGRHVEDASANEVYLCGSSGMIEAAIKVVRAKGTTEDRIYYDKFD